MTALRAFLMSACCLLLAACNELASETAILNSSQCLVQENGYFREISAKEFHNKHSLGAQLNTVEKLVEAWEKAKAAEEAFAKANPDNKAGGLFLKIFEDRMDAAIANNNQPIEKDAFQKHFTELFQDVGKLGEEQAEELKQLEKIPELQTFFTTYMGHMTELSGGGEFNLFASEKPGFFFKTGNNCQSNSFTVDPESISEKSYKDIKDKTVSAHIYRFKQFENPVYLRQIHKPSKDSLPYEYDFFFPADDNKFVSYTIKDARLIVMAMYGDVWFDDWSPSESDITALDSELSGLSPDVSNGGFSFRKFDNPKIDGSKQNYPAVYNQLGDNRFKTQPANSKMIRAIVTLLNEFEQGRVNISNKIADAGTRKYFEFKPDSQTGNN